MKIILLTLLLSRSHVATAAAAASEESPEASPAGQIERYLNELTDPIADYEIFVDKAVEIWKRVPAATKDFGPVKSWSPEKENEFLDRCHSGPVLTPAEIRLRIPSYNAQTAAWELYFLCRAFVEKTPGLCAGVRSVREKPEDNKTLGVMCWEGYYYLEAAAAIISRAPDAASLCEKLGAPIPGIPNPPSHDSPFPKDPAQRREICSSIAKGADATSLCTRLSKMLRGGSATPEDINDCRETLCTLRGEGGCVKGEPNPFDKGFSEILVSYRRAWAAKDAELCGDSSLCRSLMGAGDKQCADYSKLVKKEYCAVLLPQQRADAIKNPPPSTAMITPELSELRGLLKSLIVHELKRPRLPDEMIQVEELKMFMLQTEKFTSVRAVLQEIMKVKQSQFASQFEQADRLVAGFEPRSHPKLPGLQKKLLQQHKRMEAAFKKFKTVSDR